MNKVYKVIWNDEKQCYVVASELAKSKGKSKSSATKAVKSNPLQKAIISASLMMGMSFANFGGSNNNTAQASCAQTTYAYGYGDGQQQQRGCLPCQQTQQSSGRTTISGDYVIVNNGNVTTASKALDGDMFQDRGGQKRSKNAVVLNPTGNENTVSPASVGTEGVAVGNSTHAGQYSTVVGSHAQAEDYGTAYGYNANAEQVTSTAIGTNSYAKNIGSVAVGNDAFVGGSAGSSNNFLASALDSRADSPVGGTALGTSSVVSKREGVALGAFSRATSDVTKTAGAGFGALTQEQKAAMKARSEVSFGFNAGEEIHQSEDTRNHRVIISTREDYNRRLTHVAGGVKDNDAVNMAQLRSVAANKISFSTDEGKSEGVSLGSETDSSPDRLTFDIKGDGKYVTTTAIGSGIKIGLSQAALDQIGKQVGAGSGVRRFQTGTREAGAPEVLEVGNDEVLHLKGGDNINVITNKVENGNKQITVALTDRINVKGVTTERVGARAIDVTGTVKSGTVLTNVVVAKSMTTKDISSTHGFVSELDSFKVSGLANKEWEENYFDTKEGSSVAATESQVAKAQRFAQQYADAEAKKAADGLQRHFAADTGAFTRSGEEVMTIAGGAKGELTENNIATSAEDGRISVKLAADLKGLNAVDSKTVNTDELNAKVANLDKLLVKQSAEVKGDLKVAGKLTGANINTQYVDDSGKLVKVNLGEQLNLKGGTTEEATKEANIKVEKTADNEMSIKLAKNLKGLGKVSADEVAAKAVKADKVEAKDIKSETLTTTGKATFGSAEVKGDFKVDGKTETNGLVNHGNITTDTLTVKEGADIKGDTTIEGNTNIGGDTHISGDTHIDGKTYTNTIENKGDINTDNINVRGNLTINGKITGANINTQYVDDAGNVVKVDLGEKLKVKGGATGAAADVANIKVEKTADGELSVKLAKDLGGLGAVSADSVTAGGVNVADHTVEGLGNVDWNAADNAGGTSSKVGSTKAATESQLAHLGKMATDAANKAAQDAKDAADQAIKNAKRNFAGDTGSFTRAGDEVMTVAGGATGELTEGNIGTVAKDGKVSVKLAADLAGLNSVSAKALNADDVNAKNVTADKVDAKTVNAKDVNADNVKAKDVKTETLTTTGKATLDSAEVNHDLTVNGTTNTNGIENKGNINTDTINVKDKAKVGSLETTGDAQIGGNATVKGNATIEGKTETNGILNHGDITTDTLHVKDNAEVKGKLTVEKGADIKGGLEVDTVNADKVSAKEVKAETVKADKVETKEVKAETVKADKVETKEVKADAVKADKVDAKEVKADAVKADKVDANDVKAGTVEADKVKTKDLKVDGDVEISGKLKGANINTQYVDDAGNVVKVNLGEQLKVKGGATGAAADAANIKVEKTAEGELSVKLAKDLSGLGTVNAKTVAADSVTAGGVTVANGTVSGLTNTSWSATDNEGGETSKVGSTKAATESQLAHLGKIAADAAKTASGNAVRNYAADKGTFTRTGAEVMTVAGGAAGELTEGNIGTEAKDGKVSVKLAADLAGLNSVSAKALNADDVNAKNVTADKVDAKTVNAGEVNAKTVNAEKLAVTKGADIKGGLTADTVKADQVDAKTVNAKDVNADNVKAKDVKTETLTTTGKATLDSAEVNHDLTVNGTTNTNGIENKGNINTDTINVKDKAKVGSLETTGDAQIGGNATVKGNATIEGKTETNGILNHGDITTDTLHVKDNAEVKGKLTVEKGADIKGGLEVDTVNADKVSAKEVKAETVKADKVESKEVKADAVKADKVDANDVKAGTVEADKIKTKDLKVDGDVEISGKLKGANINTQYVDDAGNVVKVNLGEQLKVKGGATGAAADAANIKVEKTAEGELSVKLAKDLSGLGAVSAESVTAGGVTVAANTVEGLGNVDWTASDNAGGTSSKVGSTKAATESQLAHLGKMATDAANKAAQDAKDAASEALKNAKRNFAGDTGSFTRSGDEVMTVAGGAEGALTEGNIGTVANDGKISVKLAADLAGLNSVSAKTVNADDVNAKNVKADKVEAKAVKADEVNAKTVNAGDVNAKNVNAEKLAVTKGADIKGGLTADTVKADQVDAKTVNAKDVNADNVKAKDVKTETLTTTGKATLDSAEVNHDLTVNGTTNTNGIENKGNINTDTINVKDKAKVGSLETTGDALIGGNATVRGNATIEGTTNTNGIENKGNINTDTINVKDKATVGSLETTGDALIGGNATVKGNATIEGKTETNGILNHGDITTDTLHVKDNAEVKGKLTVEKGADIKGGLNVDTVKATQVDAKTVNAGTVNADKVITKGLDVNGDVHITGKLTGANINTQYVDDAGSVVKVGIGEQLKVKGGAAGAATEAANIKVVKTSDDELTVKLAKDLTGLGNVNAENITANTVTAGGVNVADHTVEGLGNVDWTVTDNEGGASSKVGSTKAATESQLAHLGKIATDAADRAAQDAKDAANEAIKNAKRNFAGDTGSFTRAGDEVMTVAGGATGALTEGNIATVANDGKITVKLAADLAGLNSVSAKAVNADDVNAKNVKADKVDAKTVNAGEVNAKTVNAEKLAVTKGADIKGGLTVDTVKADKVDANTVNAKDVNADNVKAKDVKTETLTTTGKATLDSAEINHDLTVDGTTNTNGIENKGNINTDTINVKDKATVGSLETTGDAQIGGNAAVKGKLTVAKGADIKGGLTVDTVNADKVVAKDLKVNGDVEVTGKIKGANINTQYVDDAGKVVKVNLGDKLNLKGGLTGATTSVANIKVEKTGDDELTVKLAKDLTGLGTVNAEVVKAGGVTVANGSVSGLTNTEWTAADNEGGANSKVGSTQAATESQLAHLGKIASDAADTAAFNAVRHFAGDQGSFTRTGNDVMTVAGGAAGDLTEANIGTIARDGKLSVKLAADLKGINSVETKTLNAKNVNTEKLAVTNGADIKGGLTVDTVKADKVEAKTVNAKDVNADNVKAKDVNTEKLTVTKGADIKGGLTVDTVNAGTVNADKVATKDLKVNGDVEITGKLKGANINTQYVDDAGQVVKVNIGDQLKLQGGSTEEATTEDNVKVVKAGDDTLKIKLANKLKGLQEVNTNTLRANTANVGGVNFGGISRGVDFGGENLTNIGNITAAGTITGGTFTTTGGRTVITDEGVKADKVTVNKVVVDGAHNTVSGLSNTKWEAGYNTSKAGSNVAATEGQLADLGKYADATAKNAADNLVRNFAGNTGTTSVKGSQTLTIQGDSDLGSEVADAGNVITDAKDGKITISLNKNIGGFSSVQSDTVLANSVISKDVSTDTIEAKAGNISRLHSDDITVKRLNVEEKIVADKATIGGVAIKENKVQTGKITIDGKANTATFGNVKVDAGSNVVTGLANTAWTGKAVSGRAATEDQLQAVDKSIEARAKAVVADSHHDFVGDAGTATVTGAGPLNVKGGADTTKLTDNNIAVVAKGDGLNVKLAKNVKGLESVQVVDSYGDTTTALNAAGVATKGTVSANTVNVGDGNTTIDKDGHVFTKVVTATEVDGLSNTKWDAEDAVAGRAATEGQLLAALKGIKLETKTGRVEDSSIDDGSSPSRGGEIFIENGDVSNRRPGAVVRHSGSDDDGLAVVDNGRAASYYGGGSSNHGYADRSARVTRSTNDVSTTDSSVRDEGTVISNSLLGMNGISTFNLSEKHTNRDGKTEIVNSTVIRLDSSLVNKYSGDVNKLSVNNVTDEEKGTTPVENASDLTNAKNLASTRFQTVVENMRGNGTVVKMKVLQNDDTVKTYYVTPNDVFKKMSEIKSETGKYDVNAMDKDGKYILTSAEYMYLENQFKNLNAANYDNILVNPLKALRITGEDGDDKVLAEKYNEVYGLTSGNIKTIADEKGGAIRVKLVKDIKNVNSLDMGREVEVKDEQGQPVIDAQTGAHVTQMVGGPVMYSGTAAKEKGFASDDKTGGIDMRGGAIHNVADGQADQDAVNVRQVRGIRDQLGRVSSEVREVGAMSAALSALKPMAYDPTEPTQILAGVGGYRGKKALAVGLAHYTNEHTMINAGMSLNSDSHIMFNAGIAVKFGVHTRDNKEAFAKYQAEKNPIGKVAKLQADVVTLQSENNKIRQENATIRQENAEMKAKLSEIDDLKAQVEQLKALLLKK